MSDPIIPKDEPASFVSGETVKFKKSFTGYPASEWTLTYYFRGAATGINVIATADGDDYLVTISVVANTLAAGVWNYQSYLTKGSEKVLASHGTVEVLPSLTGTASTTFDGRSEVKKILDAIRATILGKATQDQLEYEIQSGNSMRRLRRMEWADLIAAETHYASLYAREQQAERLRKGSGFFKTIHTRFTKPQ